MQFADDGVPGNAEFACDAGCRQAAGDGGFQRCARPGRHAQFVARDDVTQDEAADRFGISRGSVQYARVVMDLPLPGELMWMGTR
jgi:hypothetical protein